MFNKYKNLREAISRDDATQMKKIDASRRYYEYCTLAVTSNAPKALRALLEKNGGFYFTPDSDQDDQRAARKLLEAAASSANPVPLLSVLYDINRTTAYGRLDISEFLNKDSLIAFTQAVLKEYPSVFGYCVKNVGLQSPENQKLASILDFAPASQQAQSVLDAALAQVVNAGDIEKAKLLLGHQANPNADKGTALLRAGESSRQDIVDLLLPHVKPAICGEVLSRLERGEYVVPPDILSSIAAAAAQKTLVAHKSSAESPKPQPVTDNGFTALNDHELMETTTLPGRGTLSTIFNFSAGVATIIHDKGHDAQPGLTTRGHEKYDRQFIESRRDILAGLLAGPQKAPQHTYPNVG